MLAQEYTLPNIELDRRIKEARGQFLGPRAAMLEAVRAGHDTLVQRGCGCVRVVQGFGSQLCPKPTEVAQPKSATQAV
jgi:hypothetical protein